MIASSISSPLMRLTSLQKMSLLKLLIFTSILLLGSTVGADPLASNGAHERKSSAVYDSPALRVSRRSAHRREADGELRRFPRQASDDGPLSYSPDETRALLDAHIEYRRNVTPSAADMNMIVWNTELADMARVWAERCVFEHGFPTDPPEPYNGLVAQNIWMGSQSFALTRSVTAWYNEYKDYDYATATCSAECGHYRVMVFSGLETIGCGSANCDGGRQTLTVCNYGPSVPSRGVPYKAGPACGLCASGTGWCDDKLCRTDCNAAGESCKCNLQCQNCGELDSAQCKCTCKAGWRGTDCSEPCTNYQDYCDSGAYTPEACVGDTGAQKDCPATCELCSVVSDSTAAEAKCCDGKMCDAGEVLNESSCECVDYVEFNTPKNAAAPVVVSWMFVSVLSGLVTSMPILIG
ncbi:cysteine-rich venom protein Mr30-like [Patiria miniata]|uniref:SCP domain-containing protein n=1 Tax=Patiria miniata TaxID=46514 RepID=A0A914BTI4_PATMI|nr:cysteine-rich venom protein Mr30-like [Patiria miniata]